jgi:hypothetical protein
METLDYHKTTQISPGIIGVLVALKEYAQTLTKTKIEMFKGIPFC